ncbi:MAG: chorismate synthase [Sutterella sp.]|nr:chorismate synthase [Sutterella sp.]
MSTIGRNLHVSVFGQSHAAAVGVTIDGLPAGEAVDAAELARLLARRAPGGKLATQRREADEPEILCGLLDGVTCGAPLTAVIRNGDAKSRDYRESAEKPRPSHADWPAHVRYGGWQDVRGGGVFSARLTAPLCVAGGIAMQILARRGIRVAAHVRSIGAAEDRPMNPMGEDDAVLAARLTRPVAALSDEAAERMAAEVEAARKAADSVGGTVECMVTGLPVGLGGPLFDGIDGRIAYTVFGVPGVKGVEFGAGFEAARMRGSEMNDPWCRDEAGAVTAAANRAGGVVGGMTTGLPLIFTCALKPTPSIGQPQRTVSLAEGGEAELRISGRHDPSIVIRAVPVLEAVTALTVLDALLDAPAVLPDTPRRDLPRVPEG